VNELAQIIPKGERPVTHRKCPFCQGTKLQLVQQGTETGESGPFVVECSRCGAAGPPALTMAEAALKWNTARR